MLGLHTPKEDGGWKQWWIRELRSIPTALIEFFAVVAIIIIVFAPMYGK